jgi:hypothetical protein
MSEPSAKTIQFIERAQKIHGDKYDYSKVVYTKRDDKVPIICDIHGEFIQSIGGHLQGQGCRLCGFDKNRRTLTNEQFIEQCVETHGDRYDYSKVQYVHKDKKVIIICAEHGEFQQCANSHKRGSGCRLCSLDTRSNDHTRLTTEGFIEQCREIHGDRYDYSRVEYIRGSDRVVIICALHGEFVQIARNHKNLKHGCPSCGALDSTKKQMASVETFIERATQVHGDKYDYSEVVYDGCNRVVSIICPEHGQFEQKPYNHVNRGGGCCKCSGSYQPTTEEFIGKAKQVHGDKYDYSEVVYDSCDHVVVIICPMHGRFEQTPYIHVNLGCGCRKCSYKGYSKGQIEWLTFLEGLYGIQIVHFGNSTTEYSIPQTRWKADGYHEASNTIYEYHGDYWHGNPRLYSRDTIHPVSNRPMGELYQNTIDREQQIKALGYNLVVMWESDWNRIKKSVKILQSRFRMDRITRDLEHIL